MDTMKSSRDSKTSYLLAFCKTCDERDTEEARLDALTDEELEAEFTTEYNCQNGICPDPPLYEGSTPDLYIDF